VLRSRLRILALALSLLGGCQPLPQPFAEDAPPPGSPILTPRDGAGIWVAAVDGVPAPLGAGIAAAVAAALQESDVPAATQAANKASYKLLGTAEEEPRPGGAVAVTLRWELRDHDGATVGTRRQTLDAPLADWRAGKATLLAALAKAAAPPIADLLQDEGTTAAAADGPRLIVRPVRGAPGDGPRALARALRMVLKRQNVAVAETDKAADAGKTYTIDGSVAMAAAAEGKQKVRVTWALFDPEGAQIGQVSQENAVAAGSLDGAWGSVAYAVAEAAAGGILALLDRAKAAGTGS